MDKIKVKDLKPAEYNPRKIDDEELIKLENSIENFGFVSPIIVNLTNNHIIGGHQRYKVISEKTDELNLIKLGDIGLAFIDEDIEIEDEEHEKALNIALNKIQGKWDIDKLLELLEDLEMDDMDVELTGFEQGEILELELISEIEYRDMENDTPREVDQKTKKYLCPHCNEIVEI